jgi:hypothetical protein
MTPEHTHPRNQPGQRALRLIVPEQLPLEVPQQKAAPGAAPAPSASPALRRLQRELEAARAEAQSLHELLEELPAILERKLRLRLGALVAEQRQLEHDNAVLHHHLLALGSGDPSLAPPLALPPAADRTREPMVAPEALAAPAQEGRLDSSLTQGLGLRRALRHLHR